MKNSKVKILILILLIYRVNVFSQDALKYQYRLADSLYKSGKYFEAITEYKRLLFFDAAHKYGYEADKKIAECYKAGGKYSDAIFYYHAAGRITKKKDEIKKLKVEVIKINILRKNTAAALGLIDELEKDSSFTFKKNEADLWRGWAAIFNDNWEQASRYFNNIDKNHPLKLMAEKVENDKYSVTLAKLLSVFLPGAGQFYTGNYLSGFLSLGWNFLWGYISVNSFIENRAFDGLMTANFLWLRFYTGSIQNAEKFAVIKNLEITNNAMKFLQNNYNGEKP